MSDQPGAAPENQHSEDPPHDEPSRDRDDVVGAGPDEETPAETTEPDDDGPLDGAPQDAEPQAPEPEQSGPPASGPPASEALEPDHAADFVPASGAAKEWEDSPATTESPVAGPVADAARPIEDTGTGGPAADTSPRQDAEGPGDDARDDTSDGTDAADGDGDAPDDARPAPAAGTRRLWNLFRPRNRRAEYITAALCVAFGFALAVQVAQSTGDQLASLRQDELVRLLDEVTQRGEQLDAEVANLTAARDDLRSADGQDRAARELAERRAEYEGILSGRLPAEGPGVVVEIEAGPGTVTAANMFNMLEELRNAGVEAQQVNDVRIVTSSHFEETVDEQPRILLDGRLLEPPYRWVAIGDPETVDRALEIPGGALPTLRDAGATAEVTRQEHVVVDATRMPADPEHAEPSEE